MRLYIYVGQGVRDRVVYNCPNTYGVLAAYVKARLPYRVKKVILIEKGTCKGKPLSVHSIQNRMDYYAKKTGLSSLRFKPFHAAGLRFRFFL